jgi:hypothetical protein
MFNSVTAFGKNHGDTLTHDDIIVHLRENQIIITVGISCIIGFLIIIIFLRLLFHLLTLTPFQWFVGFIILSLLYLGIVNMFNSVTAFGKNHGDTLTHDDIIVHLRGVYERWIKFENKSNEFQYPNKGDMEHLWTTGQ